MRYFLVPSLYKFWCRIILCYKRKIPRYFVKTYYPLYIIVSKYNLIKKKASDPYSINNIHHSFTNVHLINTGAMKRGTRVGFKR